MVDDDLELERDLGEAAIVYDDPDEGTVRRTVPNEHVAYFQDHWILKTEEHDDHDVVRRIPTRRVHYVERSVEEFESEVRTLRNQVQSIADDLRSRLPVGGGDSDGGDGDGGVHHIDVEDDETSGGS